MKDTFFELIKYQLYILFCKFVKSLYLNEKDSDQ